MSHDKRQVIRIRDVSPDVQVVDASQVGRAWDSQRTVSSVASGKRMPGKESMAISRAPLSLDMTATCSSGVAPMSAHPPAVTSIPAMSTATITSGEIEEVGSSAVAPLMDMEDSLTGCPYRFTSYSGQPFSDGNPAFGLQLHHPRFLESVGAPESARLLYRSPTFWVDQLGEEQAIAAAVNLQRDAGIMLSNLQIMSQFAMSLHRMSSEMMVLGIGQMVFPQAEVADLSPAPRTPRAAKYMSAMGMWHPQTGPGDPGPVPASSCRTCMTCEYCFPED